MKKPLILPLSLLLSFITTKPTDVSAKQSFPAISIPAQTPSSPVTQAVQPAVETTPTLPAPTQPVVAPSAPAISIPAQNSSNPVTQTVQPAGETSSTLPAPAQPIIAPSVQTAPATPALPTEADINNLLGLVNAYNKQSSVLKSLHDLASDETIVPNLPNEESVRSLLHLLELHKKEADLITSLRASIASIQAALGQWDTDIASLVTKHKKSRAKRSVDFAAIKDMNKPKGHN